MIDESAKKRIWAGVKIAGPDDCWEWQRSRLQPPGLAYGQTNLGRKVLKAHRVIYAIAHQINLEDIADVIIRHDCDNPPCCNPRHLLTGNHVDNARDRDTRGRANTSKGVTHGGAKLTELNVKAIRLLIAQGINQESIARLFGVYPSLISSIRHNRRWKHLS
jgi:hypothetical protein